jgi:Xaa-Pro aminopeptidase
MEFLYSIPGMEDVEDVIVSSGRTPGPTGATSRSHHQPGDIVFMDLGGAHLERLQVLLLPTYCVGKEPTDEQKECTPRRSSGSTTRSAR